MYITLLPEKNLKVGDMFFNKETQELYVIVINNELLEYHLVVIESGELYGESFESISDLIDYYEIKDFRILKNLKEF